MAKYVLRSPQQYEVSHLISARRRRLTTQSVLFLTQINVSLLRSGVFKVKDRRQVIEGQPHLTKGMHPYIRVTWFA